MDMDSTDKGLTDMVSGKSPSLGIHGPQGQGTKIAGFSPFRVIILPSRSLFPSFEGPSSGLTGLGP